MRTVTSGRGLGRLPSLYAITTSVTSPANASPASRRPAITSGSSSASWASRRACSRSRAASLFAAVTASSRRGCGGSPAAHPVPVPGERPAVAGPPVGDVRALRQRPQQVEAPPHRVPGGPGDARDQVADAPLGGGQFAEPVVRLRRRPARRRAPSARGRSARWRGPAAGCRTPGRWRGRRAGTPAAPARPAGVRPVGRRVGAGRAPGRVDPGEQRAQVLVLQAALAGGPVPGQQVRQGQQQRRSRAPGPAPRSGSASGRAAAPAAAPGAAPPDPAPRCAGTAWSARAAGRTRCPPGSARSAAGRPRTVRPRP